MTKAQDEYLRLTWNCSVAYTWIVTLLCYENAAPRLHSVWVGEYGGNVEFLCQTAFLMCSTARRYCGDDISCFPVCLTPSYVGKEALSYNA